MRGTWTCSGAALAVIAVAVGLPIAGLSAQPQPADIDDVLARAAARVEQYIARAQKIVLVERTFIQHVRSDLTPQGFARVVESDLRVESEPGDGTLESSEPKVIRQLRTVNGHAPRKKDEQGCLDPNPISPEPLTFLLPARRGKYAFTMAGTGKSRDKNTVMVDFRELGGGKPEVTEMSERGEGCYNIEVPGRGRGRVWLDASTYEVLRIDQRISGWVDFRIPETKKNRRIDLPDFQVLERLDTSIRYKPVAFRDPEEIMLLPESIETLMVVRGMQSYRMRQVFSDYRRFVTSGRLVK